MDLLGNEETDLFGKRKKILQGICKGPVPPLGSMNYAAIQKFIQRTKAYAEKNGINGQIYLNWAIEVLLHSLETDSASRIFLPKTETSPFDAIDLFPFDAVETYTIEKVSLERAYLIAPIWNDGDVCRALADAGRGQQANTGREPKGYYIADIGLAVICEDVHEIYFSQLWSRGEVLLNVVSLADLADVISTDGENWYISGEEDDDDDDWYPVAEPRMAALYDLALQRLGFTE
jgi:hypothetical protein